MAPTLKVPFTSVAVLCASPMAYIQIAQAWHTIPMNKNDHGGELEGLLTILHWFTVLLQSKANFKLAGAFVLWKKRKEKKSRLQYIQELGLWVGPLEQSIEAHTPVFSTGWGMMRPKPDTIQPTILKWKKRRKREEKFHESIHSVQAPWSSSSHWYCWYDIKNLEILTAWRDMKMILHSDALLNNVPQCFSYFELIDSSSALEISGGGDITIWQSREGYSFKQTNTQSFFVKVLWNAVID